MSLDDAVPSKGSAQCPRCRVPARNALYGELGAILALTNEKAASGGRGGRSTLLVAGARNHRELTLLV